MDKRWLYNGLYIDEIPDSFAYGFIYKISYIDQESGKEKSYIGKKNFYFETNVKKGKKELIAMADKRGSKKKKVVKESDWKKYKSSNDFLNSLELNALHREILLLCYSKTELTYQETKHLFLNEVLESDKYLNNNILGKFYKVK